MVEILSTEPPLTAPEKVRLRLWIADQIGMFPVGCWESSDTYDSLTIEDPYEDT